MNEARPLKVNCPACGAGRGKPCKGGKAPQFHQVRWTRYENWAATHPSVSQGALTRAANALAKNKARIERS